MFRRTKDMLVDYAYEAVDLLMEAGEIVGCVFVYWVRGLVKAPYYIFWALVLAGYFAWTGTRRQRWYVQIGIALIALAILAMIAAAIFFGDQPLDRQPGQAEFWAFFGMLIGGLLLCALGPQKPGSPR
ncbi:MAG TPA: hypothetical protein VFP32_03345 [Candidatus Saccharimonadales bacterium]|nr:hypothetical protein [Candidatus Saccharimonadales bacterium]